MDLWVPYFFPAMPPTPPPPCLNGSSSHAVNTSVTYEVRTSISQLCAPAPGKDYSTLKYSGIVCDGNGHLLWTSMYTEDPRSGLQPSDCTWKASDHDSGWQEMYTGECGESPAKVPELPNSLCP